MAGVLETFTVPRASPLHDAASSLPIRSQSVSASHKPLNLPQFRGLKSRFASSSSSPVPFGSTHRTVTPPRGGIACEAAVLVPNISEANWQKDVLDSDSPVLVEFWAPWCGPCRMITPIIDELAKEYTGKLKCFKVNTDESPSVATRYGIRSIPTVIIFKGGEKKDAIIGAVPKSTLTTSIEKFL